MKKVLLFVVIALMLAVPSAHALTVVTVDLIADGGDPATEIVVGDVTITNDGSNLLITFTTTDGWYLAETHLDIEVSPGNIPQTGNGNPKVGKFEILGEKTGMEFPSLAVTSTTYSYNLGALGLEVDDDIFIAAHASVEIQVDPDPQVEGDEYIREETAWGDGTEFAADRNWAMYIVTVVPEPEPED